MTSEFNDSAFGEKAPIYYADSEGQTRAVDVYDYVTSDWRTAREINRALLEVMTAGAGHRIFGRMQDTLRALSILESDGLAEKRKSAEVGYMQWRRKRCPDRSSSTDIPATTSPSAGLRKGYPSLWSGTEYPSLARSVSHGRLNSPKRSPA